MYKQYKDTIGFEVEGYLDSFKAGECFEGKIVKSINEIDLNSDIFIVIAAVEKRDEIERLLEKKGLVRGKGYI